MTRLRFDPDPDATEFAKEVAALLEKRADRAALRAAWDSEGGRIAHLWRDLAAMGATGLAVPEEFGGAGLDLTATMPLLIEVGRAGLPEPLATTIAAAEIVRRSDEAARWLPGIADGSIALGLGAGPGGIVVGVSWADQVIVAAGQSEVLVLPVSDIGWPALASADRGRRLAGIGEIPETATKLSGVDAASAFDVSVVTTAAELLGVAQAMLEMSVEYAKTREQFGQPIGGFQAIKHHLANVYVGLSFARPVVARGMWSVATGQPTASRDTSHAMAAAGHAAKLAARIALQVHAGIGYTYEHDLHMWLKRTWTLTSVFGDPSWHRERVATFVVDGETA